MTRMIKGPENAAELRKEAEAIALKTSIQPQGNLEVLSVAAMRTTLHELRVHQIELEMQNEELRRAQIEQDALQARYFDLYDLAPVGYITVGEHGLILEANLTASTLLGVTRRAMIKRPLTRFLFPEDQDGYYLHRKRLSETGSPQGWELRMVRQDGTVFWAHLDTAIAQDSEGSPLFRIVLNNITERRAAEAEKAVLHAQLQQSQKMESLGSLAGGVAHDMNNILGAILGMATANIQAQPAGSPTYRAFDTIIQATQRGGKMIKSLLSFARQTPAEEQELDLNEVLREEVRMLERTTLAKVRLEMDLAPELRPIRGDTGALTNAFMNLCVNAVDAMPDNGVLRLRTRNVDQDWIEIMVEDTGSGMSKEILGKALNPFFTTKEVGKGTGLGLSMAYRTVQAHQGQMEILSEPGQGTRIMMRFPACEAISPLQALEIKPQMEPSQASLTVLVVDDDELIQSTMQALLEIQGHLAVVVSSGEEALERLRSGCKPDVVILDMNMPGLGGAGTLPRLRALDPTLPILLATGRVDQFALDLAAAHPHVGLLSKPYSMQELKQHLETLGRN